MGNTQRCNEDGKNRSINPSNESNRNPPHLLELVVKKYKVGEPADDAEVVVIEYRAKRLTKHLRVDLV